MTELRQLVDFYLESPNEPYVLVTLVCREGASYRQPGARMLIRADDSFKGCISGGCLEQEVVTASRSIFESRNPLLQTFDTRPHFGCGGQITVLLEYLSPKSDLFRKIASLLRNREVFFLETNFELNDCKEKCTVIARDRDTESDQQLLQKVYPQNRLLIIGAGLDIVPLCEIASSLSWEIHQIIEPGAPYPMTQQRSAYAIEMTPEELISEFKPDASTAVVIMNHHYTRDLRYLAEALKARYHYLGLLGASRRRDDLINELEPFGILEDLTCLEKLYGPVGLDLGAREPESIALSIIAEIQAVLSGRNSGFLRDRAGRIHASDFIKPLEDAG